MARPKVVVVSPPPLLPSPVLSTIVRTLSRPFPSQEWSFGDPSRRRDCGRVSLPPLFLCGRRISYSPPSSPSSQSPPPGLCSELDLIVASDSFVFLWQTREGEKIGREYTKRGSYGIRSLNETLDVLRCIMSFSLTYQRGHLRPSISPFYGCRIAQYGISSPLRLRSLYPSLWCSF